MKRFGLDLKRVAAVLTTITLLFAPIHIAAEDIVNDDCTINEAAFERNWRKYSDFDERIEPQARSWAVQQYDQIQEKIDELTYESFQLQTEMEFDRQIRLELRNVKKSLVNNLRANLVKSFFRLSFLTADAIKTGITLGQTYAKLFTAGALEALPEGLSYLKDAMDVVTGLTPDSGDSELAKEVKNSAGDLEDILKIADSPKNIASIAANRVKGQAEEKLGSLFPSVGDMKFSDEEVAILKDQNLRNRAIDDALMESYRINAERRNRITSDIPMEIQQLQINQARLEEQEKERVRDLLIAECKDKNKDDDRDPEESEGTEFLEEGPKDDIDLSGRYQIELSLLSFEYTVKPYEPDNHGGPGSKKLSEQEWQEQALNEQEDIKQREDFRFIETTIEVWHEPETETAIDANLSGLLSLGVTYQDQYLLKQNIETGYKTIYFDQSNEDGAHGYLSFIPWAEGENEIEGEITIYFDGQLNHLERTFRIDGYQISDYG